MLNYDILTGSASPTHGVCTHLHHTADFGCNHRHQLLISGQNVNSIAISVRLERSRGTEIEYSVLEQQQFYRVDWRLLLQVPVVSLVLRT